MPATVTFAPTRNEGHCRYVPVFVNRQLIGELYRETAMPEYAADSALEKLFGLSALDGERRLRDVKRLAQTLAQDIDLAPCPRCRQYYNARIQGHTHCPECHTRATNEALARARRAGAPLPSDPQARP